MSSLEPAHALTACLLFLLFLSISCGPGLADGLQDKGEKEIPVCALKNNVYHQKAFSIMAAYKCYHYLNKDLKNPNAAFNISTCKITAPTPPRNYSVVPCYKPPGGGLPLLFNHSDQQIRELVSSSLWRSKDSEKWLRCSEAADKCCAKMVTDAAASGRQGKQQDDAKRCPPQWDAWYCWPNGGTPGAFEQGDCPDYIYSNTPPTCTHHQTKECFENGTWREMTDYSTCSVTPRISARLVYHVVVLGVSLIAAIPALIIFFSYRKLRVTRVRLHRSLIMAIAARNLSTILSSTTVILPELYPDTHGVMAENGIPCRVLATVERLSANAVFACMLLEGLYLHRLIAAAFRSETCSTPAVITAVVLAFVPAIAWAAVMATLHDSDCWYVESDGTGYQWINDAPRIAMLVVNTILLIDIARVMLTKLRSSKSANAGKLRMTAKATLFLMPLFGVQLLFTVARPDTKDCVVEQVYFFFAYTADGLQGFVVVLIYCFLNKEVKELLARSFRVWSDKFGIQKNLNASAVTSRRATLLTTLPVPKSTDGPSEVSAPRNSMAPPAKGVHDDNADSDMRSVANRRESHV